MLAIALTPPAVEMPAELPAVGMSEERWCATIGKDTAQCAWRRKYGFEVPLPPRDVPGWPPPETYLAPVLSAAPPCAQYGGCIGQVAEEPPERPWWLLSILGGILLAGAGVMYYQARKEERRQRYGD